MLDSGHIQLYRSLLKWEWYDDINTTRLFIHLLLTVNWKASKWQGMEVNRGQRVTSLAKLSKETGLSVQCLRTSIKRLISTQELTCETNSKYSLLTINNYDRYQSDNTLSNNQPTSVQQASNKHLTTNEESNKAINITTTATTAREAEISALVKFYEANGFGMIARCHFEDMGAYLDEGVSALLVERCMKEAVDCGSPNWAYVKRILERCEKQKVKSVEDFEANKKKKESGGGTREEKPSERKPLPGAIRL